MRLGSNFPKMDFEWKRVRFEFDAFTFVNVRLERSVRREDCVYIYFFFFVTLSFQYECVFRLFSTFQLSGFNRPSMNFQFYMKLRNFRNRNEATRNRCSY